jgi:DNA-directed RNA polymerase subunit RPC12/RpoP
MLQCDYCGSKYTVQEIEKLFQDKLDEAEQASAHATAAAQSVSAADAEAAEACGDANWDAEQEGMKLYNCPSCGAQLICDATTAATSCPYCGNPTVIPGQFHGMLKPDYILPFRVSKEEAVAALTKYYRGKRLLPRTFTEQNHIQEIKGMYVPFWLFDSTAYADMEYRTTRVTAIQQGDEMITTTDNFQVRRAGTVRFQRIPADGSRKMPDELMDSIEPFDYSDLKPFSTAYMPGFLADIYDVDDRESYERVKSRGTHTAEQLMDQTVSGYSSVVQVRRQVQMKRERTAYALLPVWMLSTQWNGANFIFAMNGQSGKFIGDLPVSMKRYFAHFAGIAAPLMALMALLLYFL